jgi:hypothetical protein
VEQLTSISGSHLRTFHVERGLAPRPAFPAAQLPFERHQARVAGPVLQQLCVRNDRLVPAGTAARAHQVENAQILEVEGVARRHLKPRLRRGVEGEGGCALQIA